MTVRTCYGHFSQCFDIDDKVSPSYDCKPNILSYWTVYQTSSLAMQTGDGQFSQFVLHFICYSFSESALRPAM